MSVKKMMSLHTAGGELNEALAQAVHHAMYCAAMCSSCADACLAEPMDMSRCIRLDLDCADICQAVSRVGARRTADNVEVVRTLLAACIEACEACADECAKHDHEHCRLCAEICRECADDCRTALGSLG